ncbi:MAG: hypothetical protein QM704_21645 [Anaeromyxobacteraceae bacterium]
MLPVILAAVLGVSSPEATLFTAEGGRVRGAVVEAGPAGVTLRLADGTTRRFPPAEVRRIVLADGTTWQPGEPAPRAPEPEPVREPAAAPAPAPAPAPTPLPEVVPVPAPPAAEAAPPPAPAAAPTPAPAPEPAPAPVLAAPEAHPAPAVAPAPAAQPEPSAGPMVIPVERLDTLFLEGGGRVRAFVVEETADLIVVRTVDGHERRFPPARVASIAYADGTTSPPRAAPR